MNIKPFGLRATHITDGCGTVVPLCGQTFTFTPTLATTELRCNDTLTRRSFLEGVEVAIENAGFSTEAWAIMTGAVHNEVTDPATQKKTVSVSQRGGTAFPYFGLYGKALGENGELDMHIRLHRMNLTAIDASFSQNEYMVQSATGFAHDTPDGIYELVLHEEPTDLNYMPSLEVRPPYLWFDSPSNCEGLTSGSTASKLTDLTFTPPIGSRDANQLTVNAQPVVRAYGQNGLTVLDFDGTDDEMSTSLPDTTPNTPATLFFVAQVPTGVTSATLLKIGTLTIEVDAGELFEVSATTGVSSAVTNNGGWHVHAIIVDGASTAYYVDGVQTATGDIGASTSGDWDIGSGGGSAFAQMTFGEARWYDGTWTDADIKALTAGLMEKWGIA